MGTPHVDSRRLGATATDQTLQQEELSDRPSTAPQNQYAANVWDDLPVCAEAAERSGVARRLDVEDAEMPASWQPSSSVGSQPVSRAKKGVMPAAHDLEGIAVRPAEQVDADEEAELLEFESLERKVVQAGADDSMYRGVLNEFAHLGADDSDQVDMGSRREAATDGAATDAADYPPTLDAADYPDLVDAASMDRLDCFVHDESEAWDSGAQESEAIMPGKTPGHDSEDEEVHKHPAAAAAVHPAAAPPVAAVRDGNAFTQGGPTRSSLVDKLFLRKQTKGSNLSATCQQKQKHKGPQHKDDSKARRHGCGGHVVGETEASEQEREVRPGGGREVQVVGADDEALARAGKMAELDKEIREFRRQNELLDKLRQDLEAEREQVHREKAGLAENLHEAEMRFARYKDAELKKLKKDRKDMEKQLQLAQAQVADVRGERDSIKQEMVVLQQDAARREKKLKSELERMKKKVEDTQQRNEEVVRELKFSEEARVAMQDKEELACLKARMATSAKAKANGACEPRSVAPAVRMHLSPRSQDALASQIAARASAAQTPLDDDLHLTSILPSSQRGRADGGGDNDNQGNTARSASVLSSSVLLRALDASMNDSNSSSSKYLESASLQVDDSMAASFQVDRASMVTDETLEIDVAKLTSKPHTHELTSSEPRSSHSGRHTSKSSCTSSTQEAAAGWCGALDGLDVEPPASHTSQTPCLVSERKHGDGKVERVFADGKKLLIFSNGTRKWSQASSTPKTGQPPVPQASLRPAPCALASPRGGMISKHACMQFDCRLLATRYSLTSLAGGWCLCPRRATRDRQRGVSGRRKPCSLLQQRC